MGRTGWLWPAVGGALAGLCGAGLARSPVLQGLEPVQHSLAANFVPVGVGLGGLAVSLAATGLGTQTRRRYLRGSLVIAAIAVGWYAVAILDAGKATSGSAPFSPWASP